MTRKGARERVPRLETDIVRETRALCEVLNWSDQEAAQAEADLGSWIEGWNAVREGLQSPLPADYHDAALGVIALLRRVGVGVVDSTARDGLHLPIHRAYSSAHSWIKRVVERDLKRPVEPGSQIALEPTEAVNVSPDEAHKLTLVANMNPRLFSLQALAARDGKPEVIVAGWSGVRSVSTLVWATRGLFAALLAEVQLARCKVEWQRVPRKAQQCGRVFIVAAPPGHPVSEYCSEACKRRWNRRLR